MHPPYEPMTGILQQIMDAAGEILIYAFDLQGRCLIANKPVAELFDMTPGAMLGKTREQFMSAETAAAHFANDCTVARSGVPVTFEEITEDAGGVRIYSSIKFPLRDDGGNLVAVIGLSSNITAQRIAEAARQHSERRFESLTMIAPVGIFRTDADGNCNYTNDFWCRMVGMSQEEVLDGGWIEALHPDDRQKIIDEWNQRIAEKGAFTCEYRLLRPEGDVAGLYCQTTPICDAAGAVTGYVGAVTDITPIKQTQQELADARRQIKAMAQKCVEKQEKERADLSREIHDEIGQMMTALKLSLTQASQKVPTNPANAVKSIKYAMNIADEVIDSVRDIARQLRPPQLDDLGLMASLRWHINRIAAQSAPTILFHENIGNARFDAGLELTCFRVAQEAICNALRHAHARFICVLLVQLYGQLELTILDDGAGFCEMETNKPGAYSLGLLGMRERTTGIGGNFRINSQPGIGTEILAAFTLAPIP